MALEVDEIVTKHLIVWLKLAVDATIALLHAGRVPRNIEVEQVPAVGLEIETLACRIGGGMRMRTGFDSGGALKARLISSRSSGGVGPWKTLIRSSARSVRAREAESCSRR